MKRMVRMCSSAQSRMIKRTLFLSVLLGFCLSARAAMYVIPGPGNDIIGRTRLVEAKAGERLGEIGMRTGTGYYAMQAANPDIDPYKHLSEGSKVVIPNEFILPPGPRTGIVINLPEFRLYYYLPGQNIVMTFPIGIGRDGGFESGGWGTPVGMTKVIKKTAFPTWHPTQHVRDYAASQGTPIPAEFPPGPDNPLGEYAMYLGWPAILIHGTNSPAFIGTRASAGCIRMMPEAIKALFQAVPVGTTVRVINQPFKAGWRNRQLYVEAHLPLDEEQGVYNETLSSLVSIVAQETQGHEVAVSWSAVRSTAAQTTGIPQVVSLN